MTQEVFLERLSQPEAEERLKKTEMAVLAPGSVEQHGPHLPLGTDAFAAIALAEAAARKFGTVVVPLPLVGVSPYHLPWVGSLTFKPQTYLAIVDDICECLAAHGVKKLLFVNWLPRRSLARKKPDGIPIRGFLQASCGGYVALHSTVRADAPEHPRPCVLGRVCRCRADVGAVPVLKVRGCGFLDD